MRLQWTLPLLLVLAALLPFHNAAAQTADNAQLPTQLVMTDSQVGTGYEIRGGMYVVLHYVGWVYDPAAPDHKGQQFVDSRSHGDPLARGVGTGGRHTRDPSGSESTQSARAALLPAARISRDGAATEILSRCRSRSLDGPRPADYVETARSLIFPIFHLEPRICAALFVCAAGY